METRSVSKDYPKDNHFIIQRILQSNERSIYESFFGGNNQSHNHDQHPPKELDATEFPERQIAKADNQIQVKIPNVGVVFEKHQSQEEIVVKEWVGLVVHISKKTIYLDLKDKCDTNKIATNFGDLPINELSKSDRKKLLVGSIIDLTVKTKRFPDGKRKEFLETKVRNAPKITPKQMRQALERASLRRKGIQFNDTS